MRMYRGVATVAVLAALIAQAPGGCGPTDDGNRVEINPSVLPSSVPMPAIPLDDNGKQVTPDQVNVTRWHIEAFDANGHPQAAVIAIGITGNLVGDPNPGQTTIMPHIFPVIRNAEVTPFDFNIWTAKSQVLTTTLTAAIVAGPQDTAGWWLQCSGWKNLIGGHMAPVTVSVGERSCSLEVVT